MGPSTWCEGGEGPGGLPKEYLSYPKDEWTSAKGQRSKGGSMHKTSMVLWTRENTDLGIKRTEKKKEGGKEGRFPDGAREQASVPSLEHRKQCSDLHFRKSFPWGGGGGGMSDIYSTNLCGLSILGPRL